MATSPARSRARRIAPASTSSSIAAARIRSKAAARSRVYDVNEDRLTLWSSTQLAHEVRAFLMRLLRLDENQLRVVAPDVGGGFGAKFVMYPEEVVLCGGRLAAASVRSNGSRTGASIFSPRSRSATNIGTSRSPSTTTAACSACAAR